MANTKRRPGIMMYFDDLAPVVQELTDEQAGQLLKAMLSYGMEGVMPSFPDPVLRIVAAMAATWIDRDASAYEERCVRNAYKAYKRWAMERGEDVLTFEQWYATAYNGIQGDATAYNGMPEDAEHANTNTNTNTNTNSFKQDRIGERGVWGENNHEAQIDPSAECAPRVLPSCADEYGFTPLPDAEFNRLRRERMAMVATGGDP